MSSSAATTYNAEFADLNAHINAMGTRVKELLALAIQNLEERSETPLEAAKEKEAELRRLDNDTERLVTAFLMKRSPMGNDLRRVTVTMRMTSDLDRMGALAAHIARRALGLEGYKARKSVKRLKLMAEIVTAMLDEALALVENYHPESMERVLAQDKEVNQRYEDLSADIRMIMTEKTSKIEQCMHLLFIAKHLERLGDHVKGLAHAARFIATGEAVA